MSKNARYVSNGDSGMPQDDLTGYKLTQGANPKPGWSQRKKKSNKSSKSISVVILKDCESPSSDLTLSTIASSPSLLNKVSVLKPLAVVTIAGVGYAFSSFLQRHTYAGLGVIFDSQ